MDASHEQAIRQAAVLAFHIAMIERALDVAESSDDLCCLPPVIRQQVARAEEIAADDLAHCRRLIRGQY